MDFVVKKMKTIGTIFQFPTVTRRVFILVAVLLSGIGSVWGQTLDADAVVKQLTAECALPIDINISQTVTDNWPSSKGNLTDDNFFVRWQLRKANNSLATIGLWGLDGNDAYLTAGSTSGQPNSWYLNQDAGNTSVLFSRYSGQSWFSLGMGESIKIQDIAGGDAAGLKGWILECYISNLSNGSSNTEVSSYQLKVEVKFISDPFLSTAKSGVKSGFGSAEKNKATDAFGDFALSDASTATDYTTAFSDGQPKYARIYVTDASGQKVDYDTQVDGSHPLLEVTGGQAATTSKKNGLYVYNTGSDLALSGINVKLNAGVGNLKKYKVVVLLSKDAATSAEGNTVTTEPQWDYEYTYSFTYPVSIEERIETLDESVLEQQSVKITKISDILSFFGKSDSEFASSWYARWYVTDDSNPGVKQNISSSTSTGSTWTVTNYQNGSGDWPTDRWKVVDNTVWTDNTGTNESEDWFVSQCFANETRIAAPNGTSLADYAGYKIVLEVTDDNTGGDPEIKLRYIFTIPGADPFLNTAKGDTKTTGSKEIEKTVEEASVMDDGVVNDWTNSTTASPKYARIYLIDGDGKKVDSWNTDLLEVSYNGVAAIHAGTNAKNGVYVYDGGNVLDKSKLVVTLKAGAGNFKKYKVVTLFATDEGTVEAGVMTKEPQWDEEFTFSFNYPARGSFPATNINTVRTKYKTVMYNEASRSATVNLLSNWYEVAGDCDASKQDLAVKGYVRWYLTDADGNLLSIKSLTPGDAYTSLGDERGYYRYKFDSENFREGYTTTSSGGDYTGYNPTITIPDDADYNDVRIVCVATTLLDEMDMPTQEPESLQIKYIYTLKTETELKSAPFVHFVGESHRPYKIVDGTPGADQSSWSHETGLVDETTYKTENIRQDVYQTDYYIYINKTSPDPDKLLLTLPFEHWAVQNTNNEGIRTSTEPLGYFRWYDWKTDMKTSYLDVANDTKTRLSQSDPRGLMALMLSGSSKELYRDEIGVKLNAEGIAALDENKEIVIACDVSRYMDGLDDSKRYLVHEPTLSMRYLFHILPASVVANDIDKAAKILNEVEKGTKQYSTLSKVEKKSLFETYEDNGRVVVSLNGTEGKFSLRAALQSLNQYFVNNGSSTEQCNKIQWYSYYEDDEGLWKMKVKMSKSGENPEDRSTVRLAKYEAQDFNGTYTKVGSSDTKDVTVKNGTQLHLVGYLGNGSVEQAVVHYGLDFLDAKPEKLGIESPHRTADFMHENLTHGKTLDFNEFFVDETTRFDKPTNSYENYAKIPLDFTMAQYGFSYPTLYGQCASNWQIHHGGWWEGYGLAPTHSDYILLKSMNVSKISASQTFENQAFYTFWYDEDHKPLYDVTHERLVGKTGNDTKYGTYLYIDASDEARTFAQLDFKASLCAGSEIYYSAYIANMTRLTQTPPQVLFRVSTDVTEGGVTKRIPLVSFLTGDIMSEEAITTGEWYQVYGHTKIPKELENIVDGSERTYYVSIDNYAENTDGADYAVDQISFFTSSATVQVQQSSTPCDESSGVEVAILANADELITVVGKNKTETLYYRIFEKSSDPNHELASEDAVSGPYKNAITTYANVYGSAEFTANYDRAALVADHVYDQPKEGTTGFYISSTDDKVYFQFDKREFNLEMGKSYFVSFLQIGMSAAGGQNLSDWGNPYGNKICSTVFSNDITPKLLRIDLESGGEKSDGTIPLGCGINSLSKSFEITVQYPTVDGYSAHTDVMFDFYLGSKAEFKAIKKGDLYLEKAVEHMRLKTTAPITTIAELPTTYDDEYTVEMHDLIVAHFDKLELFATRTFEHTFTTADVGEKKFAAIPVSRLTSDGYICSPLEFVFNVDVNSNGPKMELGFGDVNYPHDYKRVVRVGLEQLNNMKNNQYKLHIPVSSYENKGSGKDRKLHFANPVLYLVETNDPTIDTSSTPLVVAKIFDPDGGTNKTDVYVNTSRMYLPLDFSGENCQVDFHEGYYYEVSTSFYDAEENETAEDQRCNGELYLLFKVVPEYVTWNAIEHDPVNAAGQYSGNWYDDRNWNRSLRSELYKGTTNTPSAGHPTGYLNNEEINANLTDRPGFVPMKFTYVTLLSNNHSPFLFSEESSSMPKIPGTPQNGGNLINGNNEMGTDTSPSGGSSYPVDKATLRYDMLVRYGTHANGGEGCFGHQTMEKSGDVWGWKTFDTDMTEFNANNKVYDVEKFYGNICKEIYFKPGAELRLQQRLKYEKAWVEKEMEPGKWYLMSTPLKSTYAGDMYVPTSMTDVTDDTSVKGRQVTEAFQPITFSTPTYSRTKYPIYQRAWGLQNTKVYTKTDDIRKPYYSADLKFPTLTSNLVEWSHTFNDVQVPYNNFSGFAIRAHKKSLTDRTLIRLPKADTEYDYYQWDGGKPVSGAIAKQAVDKDNAGRFVFDYESGDLEQWTIPLTNLQAQGTDEDGNNYYLVGNPFMASIDMGKFFGYEDNGTYYSYNPKLDPVYYTYEAGVLQTVNATTAAGIIRPMQAFIVKCKANDKPENIIFNRWAITDGNYTAPTLYVPENGSGNNGARQFNISLRADNNRGGSTVSVVIDEESSVGYADSEDAMTLFDSNLSDVPTVFTMANGRALSIDKRPALDVVPFGVACASSDEAVTMTIEGTDALEGSLYVIDAVTKESTEVGDGSTFTVQPNDYGRYFLSFKGNLTGIEKNDVQKGIVVSVRGKEVTVTSSDDIKLVRALSLNGATMYQDGACGTSTTFTLAGGVYIIRVENMAGEQQIVKIVVK